MATKVRSYSKGPLTCARNFEHVVQLFLKDVLKSDEMPVGETVDFFSEWNSPHIHALYWVKDAPQYEQRHAKTFKQRCVVTKFVDFISLFFQCQGL